METETPYKDLKQSMPLSKLLKSVAGTCPFCHQKAGILSREDPDRRWTRQPSWNEMVRPAAVGANLQQSKNLAQMWRARK